MTSQNKWESEELSLVRTLEVPPEPSGGIIILRQMQFFDGTVGWAIGGGKLLRTTDGGRTWRNVPSGCFQGVSLHFLCPVSVTSCWVIAGRGGSETLPLFSGNSGMVWKAQGGIQGTFPLDAFFLDHKRGWILAGRARSPNVKLFFTSDAGNRWQPLPFPKRGEHHRMHFLPNGTGWLLSVKRRPRGQFVSNLYKTSDFGFSWNRCFTIPGKASGIHVINDQRLYLFGYGGILLESIDGGIRWKRFHIGTKLGLSAMHFLGCVGLLIGTGGLVTSTRSVAIFLSTDDGRRWIRLRAPLAAAFLGCHLETWRSGVLASIDAIYRFKFKTS